MIDLLQLLLYFVAGSIFFRWIWLEFFAHLERRARAPEGGYTAKEQAEPQVVSPALETLPRPPKGGTGKTNNAAPPAEPTLLDLKAEIAALEAEVLRRADRITGRYGVSVERVYMDPNVIQDEAGRPIAVRYRPSVETVRLLNAEVQP